MSENEPEYEAQYTPLFDDDAVDDMADELQPIVEALGQMNGGGDALGAQADQQMQAQALYRAIGDVSSAHGIPPSERVHFALAGLERISLRQIPDALATFRDSIEPMMMAFYDGPGGDGQ